MRATTKFLGIAAVMMVMVATAGWATAESPPITAVRVESNGSEEPAKVAELLELEIGKPLDRHRVREVVRSLFAGGEVEWLRIETIESAGGVEVVVHLSYRSRISQIKVHTGKPVLRVKVHRWLQLAEGDPVTADAVEASQQRVLRRLQARGYADAVVDTYLNFNRSANTVEVEFEVAAGSPQTVKSVVLEGLDNEDAAAALPKFKPGARLTSKLGDRLRDQTESNLRQLGYWEAQVVDIERRIEGAEVQLALLVMPGPRYRLELTAPPDTQKIIDAAFPDPAEEELHPAQTGALVERVRERLQEMGYLMATVAAELQEDGDDRILHLEVDPGRRLRVAAVDFEGLLSLSQDQLAAAVLVSPGPAGGRRGQEISDATLEEDRRSLELLYRKQGFPEAIVARPEIEEGEEDAVRIAFAIEEGRPWYVADLRIVGLPVEAAAELEATPLDLVAGGPWSSDAVEQARRHLENALADTGYPEGRAAAEVDTSQAGEVRVVLRVEPGDFVRIGEVVITGLRRTREKLVAGTVRRAGVIPGEALSRRRILEAQRRLYEMGLFRKVDLVPLPGHEYRRERDIVVRCEEGAQRSYLFGVGYSDRDAGRLILGWSHLNLLGGAHAFSAEVSLSSTQQRYSLSLRERRTFGLDVPSVLAVYRTEEEIGERELLRRGLWIDFGDRLKRPWRPWLRYEYEIIENKAPPEILVQLGLDEQESKVASITPSLEWDTRDNPLAPIRGVFASASLQYAFPAFEAQEKFLKAFTRITVYGPIWRGFGAVGLRLGAIESYGGDPNLPDNLQIPFAYRFFAGGRTSHRAFDTDRLGIPGQTIIVGDPENPDAIDQPIGGNALILLNLEYKRQISGMFYGSIFVDAGNVWASPSTVRFGDIRWGAGLGLNYLTPAGPLRAEYGWKLDREEGESGGQVIISFGVPF